MNGRLGVGLMVGAMMMAWTWAGAARAGEIPKKVNYQGVILDNGALHDGPGYFKFALCDQLGSATYWANSGSVTGCGEPPSAVVLTVDHGRYDVMLGDNGVANMAAFPSDLFEHDDLYLRVWFSRDGALFERLDPLQPVTSVFFVLKAKRADSAAEPGVILVDAAGHGDTTTIAGGLLLANDGSPHLIKVAPGIYTEYESITIPSNTTLKCIRPRSCVIDFFYVGPFYTMGNDNIRIEGFDIQNSLMAAISLQGGESNLEIVDNRFFDCETGVGPPSGGDSITDLYIRHNLFVSAGLLGYPDFGVALNWVKRAWIEDNVFVIDGYYLSGGWIYLERGNHVTVRNNVIWGWSGSNYYGASVGVLDSFSVWIEHNSIYSEWGEANPAIGVYVSRTSGVRIRDNMIRAYYGPGEAAEGVRVDNSEDIQIEGNVIYDWAEYGVHLRDCGDFAVANNTIRRIYNNAGILYEHDNGFTPSGWSFEPKFIIRDNQISESPNGIAFFYEYHREVPPFVEKIVKGNIVYSCPNMGIALWFVNDVQVLENKVVDCGDGIGVWNDEVAPNFANIMRNELWRNSVDLDIVDCIGCGQIVRVFYNFLDTIDRPFPFPEPILIEASNFNSAGVTP